MLERITDPQQGLESHLDFINKIAFVVEEADETVYWLELIRPLKLSPDLAWTHYWMNRPS